MSTLKTGASRRGGQETANCNLYQYDPIDANGTCAYLEYSSTRQFVACDKEKESEGKKGGRGEKRKGQEYTRLSEFRNVIPPNVEF